VVQVGEAKFGHGSWKRARRDSFKTAGVSDFPKNSLLVSKYQIQMKI